MKIIEKINSFEKNLPYRNFPYSGKLWGHNLHSLCSYQGKLKPAIAHWLIELFVEKNQIVLDPLGGVGTIPFEACLKGIRAISNDKSILAYTVARGKISPPTLKEAYDTLDCISAEMSSITLLDTDFSDADFGLNASVKDYYHEKTLEEVLKIRKYFNSLEDISDATNFVRASVLHILHGNRPYALSRNSHPITPFSPTGDFIYKSVVEKTKDRIERALSNGLPSQFRKGVAINGDFRDIFSSIEERVDVIITSPPFMGMRFDRPNWLRLWFCGWNEADFHKTSLGFLERQQSVSTIVYKEFFDSCHDLLNENGVLILHLGSGKGNDKLLEDIKKIGSEIFEFIRDVEEDVSEVESHGISDRGLTSKHHFLFFLKN